MNKFLLLFFYCSVCFAEQPYAYREFCNRNIQSPVCDGKNYITESIPTYEVLDSVNKEINRRITYKKDISKYNKNEYWDVAEYSGDCEDISLRKAYELVNKGYSIEVIKLATVKINRGTGIDEYHVVLIVKDNLGKIWVLDNIFNKLLHPKDSGYQFISIQSIGGSQSWVKWE